MAEVAEFHIALDGFEEEEPVGSISYWPYEFELEEIYSSESDPDPDPFSTGFAEFAELTSPDNLDEEEHRTCIESFGSDSDSVAEFNDFVREEDHEVNLVSDLYERCIEEEIPNPNPIGDNSDPFEEDPFFRVVDENNEMGSNYLDLGLGLGLGRIDEEHDDDENDGFMTDDDDVCSGDFFVSRRCESGGSSEIREGEAFDPPLEEGLRVVGIESDSDEEVDEGIVGVDLRSNVIQVGFGEGPDDIGTPLCWDCLQLDDPREISDFHEWEEVGNRLDDRDVLSVMMDFEERSGSASIEIQQVLEGRDEMMRNFTEIQEGVEGREETMRNSGWEFLLQINNLERNMELEHDFDQDDYIYPAEYEMHFGQFAEDENAIRGSPPTAKSVVENLPSIVLSQDDVQNKGCLCAVCKDEISTEERAKLLPCSHYYHGDCILPWLNIRNTCPVCRFELPTDDPDYEQRRRQRAARGSSGVSQVRYDFQMFPED